MTKFFKVIFSDGSVYASNRWSSLSMALIEARDKYPHKTIMRAEKMSPKPLIEKKVYKVEVAK